MCEKCREDKSEIGLFLAGVQGCEADLPLHHRGRQLDRFDLRSPNLPAYFMPHDLQRDAHWGERVTEVVAL